MNEKKVGKKRRIKIDLQFSFSKRWSLHVSSMKWNLKNDTLITYIIFPEIKKEYLF